ncbi:MAG: hypothetical protein AB7Y46_05075 [Armatimonadota bacterium]
MSGQPARGPTCAMKSGWDRDLAAVEQCFTCEMRVQCAASCSLGLDIPATLERLYRTYHPVLVRHRQGVGQ